jgi:hypothetical protein
MLERAPPFPAARIRFSAEIFCPVMFVPLLSLYKAKDNETLLGTLVLYSLSAAYQSMYHHCTGIRGWMGENEPLQLILLQFI